MNKKTKQALEESIEKWEKIVKKTGIDERSDNCPLCQLYQDCDDCPVVDCEKTPYLKWALHHERVHSTTLGDDMKIECKICERHAKAELEFLKSLLPCQ